MMTGFGPNKLKSIEIEMDVKKTEPDSFSTITHESQHGTDESSCSISLPVKNPVSFSNCNYRETSKESYACNKSFISAMSSNSRGVMSSAAISGENESTTTFVTGFDLNEDINTSEKDDIIQPAYETLFSHNVIHVVAKAGIPNGLPLTPLKFEGGGLGWKGSSNTSAFRPTFRDKKLVEEGNYRPPKPDGFRGIDLNIAAEDEDNDDQIGSRSSVYDIREFASENCPKRSDGLEIDLNSLYDDADEQMIECSHQEILFDASLKRKEPEGRRDCYNLGYRQVI